MTLETTKPRSLPLRITDDISISDGSPERRNGLEKLLAALLSWLRRPRRPPDVPDDLRADAGLPPLPEMTPEARRMHHAVLIAMAMKS